MDQEDRARSLMRAVGAQRSTHLGQPYDAYRAQDDLTALGTQLITYFDSLLKQHQTGAP
jgi:hypothetical protein